MINTGDYPDGAANDPRAPYNEVENPEVEVEVYVWYSIGKSIKVKTSDYEIDEDEDEDGHHRRLNFKNTDIYSLVENQDLNLNTFDILDLDYTIQPCY